MLDLIIEQRRIPQLLEAKIITAGEEYWVIDLPSNGFDYKPNDLKNSLLREELSYLDTIFQIVGIEFFSIVRDKVVLIVKRVEC